MKRILPALALAALLAAVACAPDTSLAPQGDNAPLVVAVYGDSRTGHDVHARVVAAMLAREPAVVFHTGDLVNNGFDPLDWEIFNRITADLRARAEFFPALGNHELESPLYFDNFELPGNEQWYTVTRGPARFLVLDTNVDFSPGSEQYRWLEGELQQRRGLYTIVIFHHPPFSLSREDPTGVMVEKYLVPLFDEYAVDLVFCGHDHNYQRFFYRGTNYIIAGGGGAPLYGRTRDDPRCRKFAMTYHYAILLIGEEKLTVNVYDLDGRLLDAVTVVPRGAYNRVLARAATP